MAHALGLVLSIFFLISPVKNIYHDMKLQDEEKKNKEDIEENYASSSEEI